MPVCSAHRPREGDQGPHAPLQTLRQEPHRQSPPAEGARRAQVESSNRFLFSGVVPRYIPFFIPFWIKEPKRPADVHTPKGVNIPLYKVGWTPGKPKGMNKGYVLPPFPRLPTAWVRVRPEQLGSDSVPENSGLGIPPANTTWERCSRGSLLAVCSSHVLFWRSPEKNKQRKTIRAASIGGQRHLSRTTWY